MGEQTSQANAGSKRDINNYKELNTVSVSDKEMRKAFKDIRFDINAMSFDCKDNKKVIGDDKEVTRVEDAGYASLLFDESRISEFVTISVKPIDNAKLANVIKTKRNKFKEERANELERLENEENAKAAKRRKEIEQTTNPDMARQNIEMTTRGESDKDVV